MEKKEVQRKNGLAIASIVLGVIALALSFIPIINNAAFILGIIAIVFAVISIFRHARVILVVIAMLFGIGSCGLTLMLQSSWSNSLDEMSGDATERVLAKYLDVKIGDFKFTKSEYDIIDTQLAVTLTNKSDEKYSFTVTIEAVDQDGNRLEEDTVYANDLGPGQSQKFNIFTYLDDETAEKLKTAEFKIVEATRV